MKLSLKTAALTAALTLMAAQMVRPDTHNPPVDPKKNFWNDRSVDPRVAGILKRACADCHSHETQWPWYVQISPMNWFMQRHVEQGRAKLNLSDWSGASQDQIEEIYDSVKKNKMPLSSYLLAHPKARLSQADRDLLEVWVDGKLAKSVPDEPKSERSAQ
jgi:hypothetical protein